MNLSETPNRLRWSPCAPRRVDELTGRVTSERPRPAPDARGGLFCDEPGLGKTVTVLALLLATQGLYTEPPEARHTRGYSIVRRRPACHPPCSLSRHRFSAWVSIDTEPVCCGGDSHLIDLPGLAQGAEVYQSDEGYRFYYQGAAGQTTASGRQRRARPSSALPYDPPLLSSSPHYSVSSRSLPLRCRALCIFPAGAPPAALSRARGTSQR